MSRHDVVPPTRTRRRSPRRLVAAVAVLALAAAGAAVSEAPEARALDSTVALSIVAAQCSGTLTWRGSIRNTYTKGLWPGYRAPQSTGTVKHCTAKLRAADLDKTADYYVLQASTTWGRTTTSNFHSTAPWQVSVSSNQTARSNVYAGTKSYSTSRCGYTVDLGISIGPISLSSPQRLRCSTTLTRSFLSATGVAWKGTDASRLVSTEFLYSQKVREGVVPRYTVTFARPLFGYSWRTVSQRVGPTTYRAYVPTQTSSTTTLRQTR